MTHRVETVMDAVTAAVKGLTTTGANVFRGNPYDVQATDLPCLHVEMGPESKVQDYTNGSADWNLEIKITGTVQSNINYEQLINVIREEVHIALRTTPRLGLSFTQDIEESDPDEYVISGEAQVPTAEQGWNWIVRYRRNIDNPSL